MENNVEKKLQDTVPDTLSEKEKAYLWQNIKKHLNTQLSMNSSYSFVGFISHSKRIVVGTLVAVLIFGSYGTATYADNSAPGDFLFPVDLALERARLALSSDEKKDELLVKHSQERLKEAKKKVSLASFKAFEASSGTTTATTTKTQAGTTTPSVDSDDISNAQESLLVALDHLERNRQKLTDRGNTVAVEMIDGIINELTVIAEEQLEELEEIKIEIEEDSDKAKTKIVTKTDKVKTKFNIKTDKDKLEIKFESKKNTSNKNKDKGDNDDKDESKNENDEHEDKNNSKKVIICHKNKETLSVSKNALWAHKLHGDTSGPCGDNDNGDDKDDDDNLVFKSISSNTGTSTAVIDWETSDDSTGTIWYATSSPVMFATGTPRVVDSNSDDDHETTLSGLSPDTKYYYVIVAKSDKATATSSQKSFTTDKIEEPADTTAPIISSLSASTTATTSVKISFITNENATSKLWYGTSTPVDISGAEDDSIATATTSHSFDLSGLATSTTYYYAVEAKDGNGNKATSTEKSFSL